MTLADLVIEQRALFEDQDETVFDYFQFLGGHRLEDGMLLPVYAI